VWVSWLMATVNASYTGWKHPAGSSAVVICRVSSASSPTHSIRVRVGSSRAPRPPPAPPPTPTDPRVARPRGGDLPAALPARLPTPFRDRSSGRDRHRRSAAGARHRCRAGPGPDPAAHRHHRPGSLRRGTPTPQKSRRTSQDFRCSSTRFIHHNAINLPKCLRCVASWVVVGTIGYKGKLGGGSARVQGETTNESLRDRWR